MATDQEKLEDQNERYRDRWLSCKLSLYAAILTINGILLSVAGMLSALSPIGCRESLIAIVVLSLISALCVVWNYLTLINLYNTLGFRPISFQNDEEADREFEHQQSIMKNFLRLKPLRKALDTIALFLILVNILLLTWFILSTSSILSAINSVESAAAIAPVTHI